jgi:polyribonucleotide nucleotidyltransferase
MKFNLNVGGKNLEVELRKLAEQANGDVLVRYGDTMVLTTCVMSPKDLENLDFFPLTVEYQERYYAAGKIKGARYIRREGRPSDEAVCNSRLIDRAIRPLFPDNLKREVQVISTVLSWDGENDSDVVGLISASMALCVSDIPWLGPVAAVRIGRKDNQYVVNPSYLERENSELDIVFAGIENDGEIYINMIEGGMNEVSEELVLGAYDFAKDTLKEIIKLQKQIVKELGKEKVILPTKEKDEELENAVKEAFGKRMGKAFFQADKQKRELDNNGIKEEIFSFVGEDKQKYAAEFINSEQDRLVHENVLKYDKRSDGRKLDEIREINCEVGLIPRAHGSALFCRGITKSLSNLTLGAPGDQQLIESMELAGKKRFMHHYNFPPFSSGEVKPLRGPGRREIGHGMLAEKALLPLIPEFDIFPYTIRIVSEILSSNGSSSQASISSSSLALMDAGVPIKRPATGIAIGLVKGKGINEWKVLSDIQGPEDHHGDMDFKVAGTTEGITAIQMDVKIDGIDRKIMEEALKRGKKARLEILAEMAKVIAEPRKELSPYAPRIIILQIDPDKIREVIGPGGKVINEIIKETGVQIDIQDSGLIFITSEKEETAKKAVSWIENITREVKVGEIFEGSVKRIMNFGAFVEILPGQEGLIHISKLSNKRVERVEDVVNLGDIVSVKVIEIDGQGRINLSLITK